MSSKLTAIEATIHEHYVAVLHNRFKRFMHPDAFVDIVPANELEEVLNSMLAKGIIYLPDNVVSIWDNFAFHHFFCVLNEHVETSIMRLCRPSASVVFYISDFSELGSEKVIHHSLQNLFEKGLIHNIDRSYLGKIESFSIC